VRAVASRPVAVVVVVMPMRRGRLAPLTCAPQCTKPISGVAFHHFPITNESTTVTAQIQMTKRAFEEGTNGD
jgi:hypothetical protein